MSRQETLSLNEKFKPYVCVDDEGRLTPPVIVYQSQSPRKYVKLLRHSNYSFKRVT